MIRSVERWTVVSADAMLLAELGSGSEPEAFAVLVSTRPAAISGDSVPVSVYVAEAPGLSEVTQRGPLVSVQPPVMAVGLKPAGTASVSVDVVCDGPTLRTTIVKLTVEPA